MIKTYAIISFLVCLLLAGNCHSYQLIGTEALSEELVAQHYTINPRLDAVIVVDRTIPAFEYYTFYCAGAADEEEGQQGRIHFLEHILAGIGSQAPGKLNQIIANNGGQEYAFTTIHFMYLRLRFPKDKFDLAVEIDRDRFYNTVINGEVVKKEKKIILTEKSRNEVFLEKKFGSYFLGLVYGKKQLSYIGTKAFIEQLEPVGLRDYYENFLRLQKRLVVMIGDVDVTHVLTKLDEAYGNEQKLSALSIKFYSPQYPKSEVLGKKFNPTSKNLSVSKFRKSWYTPSLDHRDFAGLLILSSILNKRSNPLKSSLIDSTLVSGFNLNHYKGFGLISYQADLPLDTAVDAIETAIQTKLREIKMQGISKSELIAARNQQLKKMYSNFYVPTNLAYSFGRAFAHTNDPLLYPKLIKDLKSIHREDIPRIIDQYLTDDNSITAFLTLPPKKTAAKENSTPRTALHYGIMVLILVGLVLLVGWIIRRCRSPERLFSNE